MGATIANEGTVTITGTGSITTTVSATVTNVTGAGALGIFQMMVDMANLANGSVAWLEIATKVNNGTLGTVTTGTYAHALSEPIIPSIPIPAADQFNVKIKMNAGTKGKSFKYARWKLDA